MRPQSPLPINAVTSLSSVKVSVPGSASEQYRSMMGHVSSTLPWQMPPAAEIFMPETISAVWREALYSTRTPPPEPAREGELVPPSAA